MVMRLLLILALVVPGIAQAGFIEFESSHTVAAVGISGCQVVRNGTAPSGRFCGIAADIGSDRADARGPVDSFGMSVWLESVNTTDNSFDLSARSYWVNNWFEGSIYGSITWSSVFTLTADSLISAYGSTGSGGTHGTGSLLVRNLTTGALLSGPGAGANPELRLTGGSKYAVVWNATEYANNMAFAGPRDSGVPDWWGVNIVSVPEPGTLALFGAGLLGLFGARRMGRRGIPRSSAH
jgi:hypothetical protein